MALLFKSGLLCFRTAIDSRINEGHLSAVTICQYNLFCSSVEHNCDPVRRQTPDFHGPALFHSYSHFFKLGNYVQVFSKFYHWKNLKILTRRLTVLSVFIKASTSQNMNKQKNYVYTTFSKLTCS